MSQQIKVNDLIALYRECVETGKPGPVVTITQLFEDTLDSYFDRGMKTRVIDVVDKDHDNLVELHLRIDEFHDRNTKFEKANWYNSDGIPCLTATEAGTRPGHVETVYFTTDDPNVYFILEDDDEDTYQIDNEARKAIIHALQQQGDILNMRINEALEEGPHKDTAAANEAGDNLTLIVKALGQLRWDGK